MSTMVMVLNSENDPQEVLKVIDKKYFSTAGYRYLGFGHSHGSLADHKIEFWSMDEWKRASEAKREVV